MPKQRVVKLYLDNTFEEKNVSFEAGKLKDEKNEVMFQPKNVFHERKKGLLAKVRGHRKLVFFVDGCQHALEFKEGTDKMNPFWTQKESQNFVYKLIARALAKYKPMTWLQFIIIIAILMVILMLIGKTALDLGVF